MRQEKTTTHSLVFLHGFPFNSKSWESQVAYVEKRFVGTVRCLAMELRGHRPRLDSEPDPWLLQHFVSDLEGFLDEKRIEKAVLCGLSMGGYIALRFVAKNPDRVAGLILADTRADSDGNDAKEKRYLTIERLHSEGVAGFAKEFSKQVLSETTLRERPEVQAKVESWILEHNSNNLASVVGALASRADSTSELSKIKCPTMVIVGRDDAVTPVELSEKMAREIKNSELRVIEKAGHLSNIEQPDAFNEFVGEFLSDQLLGRVFEQDRIEVIEQK